LLPFNLISCVTVYSYCYSLHAINDLALVGERVYHVSDILREFLGHNFCPVFVH